MPTRKKSATSSPRRLVIVESPAKAKTIAGYLGPDYVVESSIGHIRDLPSSASDIPASHKGESWARLGVDTENSFAPLYVVSPAKRSQVTRLKSLLKDADELYLATDEDREGEAIAWHLYETLKPKVPVKRMVFHEITPAAILAAIASTRSIDRALVSAQETRRILDRLYGYEVSPVLWKKVMPKLSAGRVQSVATRILVERERERMSFTAASYWDLSALLSVKEGSFSARLTSVDSQRVASGRDFSSDGSLSSSALVLSEADARFIALSLASASLSISDLVEKPYRRSPAAPFITSTLQQEAARKMRWSASKTMRVAQTLYENGYITYMRTDSTTLSDTALTAARSCASTLYGSASIPATPRKYVRKVKNAQEAHEAIRPSGDTFRSPKDVESEVGGDESRLYELVWRRTVASQMVDAEGSTLSVKVSGKAASRDLVLSASGTTITTQGFLQAYVESSDDEEEAESRLPRLTLSESASVLSAEPEGHETQPPARYTEASLVKRLEELGIGRPSTYAAILKTIQDRGYVVKRGSALVPTFTAFAVVNLMEQHFSSLVDYTFTARLEDDLDKVSRGEEDEVSWLTRFYFGATPEKELPGAPMDGLKPTVQARLEEISARDISTIPLGVKEDGTPVVTRVGRYGPYVEAGEDRASVPEDLAPAELTLERALELLALPSRERTLGQDDSGVDISLRFGRYGPYVTTLPPEGTEPKRSSLLKSMDPDSLTLEDAKRLLSLPRSLGAHPETKEEILALNGPYGPYVKMGTESRSLPDEPSLFTVTLEEALTLLAAPKTRASRSAAPPLKELGEDPTSRASIVVKEGRFGPYVTDGTTNASLRKGDSPEQITMERALELLEERRKAGPPAKRPRKAPAKKAPAKTAAAKRATKRAPAKKAPTKRTPAPE